MKKIKLTGFIILTFITFSCVNELDTEPKVELSLNELLQQDPEAINGIMSKLYGSFALSGPNGAGSSDISDDPGESPFLRGILNLQDFTADAMKNRWGDDGLDQLTTTSQWDSNNKFFRYLYNRVYYTVPQCNNLLAILNNVDIPNKDQTLSEVRFLRSLAYYYMIDCFGKGVLLTENDLGTTTPLPQSTRLELFNFVESELLDIENKISLNNDYGKANRSAVRMLLAKLYLNAEVYTGTSRWNDSYLYSGKVISEGGYNLESNFRKNFSSDNNTSSEIIYPLIADALDSQSYGNTTYIINGSLNSANMSLNDYGALQGWAGHRSSKAWYGLFGDLNTTTDVRGQLFWQTGQTYEMTDYKEWSNGYPSIKFTNLNSDGTGISTDFSSTDFPLFRLADAYLMNVEAQIRKDGSANSQSLGYINLIRNRANATPITSLPPSGYTSHVLGTSDALCYVLDERARELNFEGHRRSDLIRYNAFSGSNYIWPWKGGVVGGTSIPNTYKLFPIPATALDANPNLTQNPGY